MKIQSAIDLIKFHEGFTPIAKPDAKGKWEYGYGFDIEAPNASAPIPEITQADADSILLGIIMTAEDAACNACGIFTWEQLNDVRKAALTDMAYEMGGTGLSLFKDMLGAIKSSDWQKAHDECLDSDYAHQVPIRATGIANMILTGQWPNI